ncbi:hypothetical protein [Gracilibacillus thailandensis]|uniref:Uncharacterized protein n=1 Tax=Gracilibacillus thailandensis TaxID=563735 RepID=A0A6N7QS34_9BACI|nr:hypothetical protein [Gracilibacillus thailandensis]MRI64823.1 hypothetical protein [Gracilibacillus thailandensis]
MPDKNEKDGIQFSQSRARTVKFRHNKGMSEELRGELLTNVYLKFVKYAYEKYLPDLIPAFEEFANDYHVPFHKQDPIIENLFWWRLAYEVKLNPSFNCFQDFVNENKRYFQKWPILRSWFQEWRTVMPKYYFIGNQFGANAFVAVDIETEKTLEIFLPLPTFPAPKPGSIAVSTLLPFCDSLYFPIGLFYQFDMSAREDVAQHLRHYQEQLYDEEDRYEVFMRIFSSLLQVEEISLYNRQ